MPINLDDLTKSTAVVQFKPNFFDKSLTGNGKRQGVLMGFFAGLFLDLASGTFFGVNTFSKMITGYGCGAFSNKVFKDQMLLPLSATIVATSASYVIMLVFVLLLGYKADPVAHVNSILVPSLVYNAIFALPVHYSVKRMKNFAHSLMKKRRN